MSFKNIWYLILNILLVTVFDPSKWNTLVTPIIDGGTCK